jgi:hypothetical protein
MSLGKLHAGMAHSRPPLVWPQQLLQHFSCHFYANPNLSNRCACNMLAVPDPEEQSRQRAGSPAAHDGLRAFWRTGCQLVRSQTVVLSTMPLEDGYLLYFAHLVFRHQQPLGPMCRLVVVKCCICHYALHVVRCRVVFGSSGHKERPAQGVLQVGCSHTAARTRIALHRVSMIAIPADSP